MSAQTGQLVISGQSNKVYSGLNITTTGTKVDCVQITNSTNITIQNSRIGPCGGNGVNIGGGGAIYIFDSYIHPETQSPGCCDHNDGILAQNAANITIQGNVIAYGESNVEAPTGVTGLTVTGNFLLNPRGQNVQAWGGNSVLASNNYTLSSTDTGLYTYPDDQEDSINFGEGLGFAAQGNYVTGGHSASGCGIIADSGANSVHMIGNELYNTGQCGLGIASGANQQIENNKVLNQDPISGGGNTAIYIWKQYQGRCGPVTLTGNIASAIATSGAYNSYYNGGGCARITQTGNMWDAAAYNLLNPPATKMPPPLIPPMPHACVIPSPYSTQTGWPACQ